MDIFFIDFGDFLIYSLYFGFNSEHETQFLRIFEFQRPSGHQMEPIFLLHHFYKETKNMGRRSKREEP
jgi:hypothetical protein